MRFYTYIALGLLAVLVQASAVTDLTAATFRKFINRHEVVMVEFFAPWCSVCKKLEPVYEDAATQHVTDKDIRFARVDCVADSALCKAWKTQIYPTFRAFKGIKEYDVYNGPRTPSDLIEAVEWFWVPGNETLGVIENMQFQARDLPGRSEL